MTESLMSRDKAQARNKGLIALSTWVGAGILVFYHPMLGLLAGVGAAVLTFRWFMFRAKRGMRF